jgi:hypothetical protein
MVKTKFTVGTAQFEKREFISKIEAYVRYLSILSFEFSETLYLFYASRTREHLPPSLDYSLLKAMFTAFVGVTSRQKGTALFQAFLKDEIIE